MPAPAVIPAPIRDIKVVAVKKLVVEFLDIMNGLGDSSLIMFICLLIRTVIRVTF